MITFDFKRDGCVVEEDGVGGQRRVFTSLDALYAYLSGSEIALSVFARPPAVYRLEYLGNAAEIGAFWHKIALLLSQRSHAKTKRGRLIIIEGADYAGKTTQVAKLAQYLAHNHQHVIGLREPGGTQLGEILRTILKDPNVKINQMAETLLFSAARAQITSEVIEPALASGKIVLLDRGPLSTLVYQGLARKIELRKIGQLIESSWLTSAPDLQIVLQVSAATQRHRQRIRPGAADKFDDAGAAFQEVIRNGYARAEDLLRMAGLPHLGNALPLSLDADVSEDSLHETIRDVVNSVL